MDDKSAFGNTPDKFEYFQVYDWNSQNLENTSIRNQVLVSLQEHERKDLATVIREKRNDIVNTWKFAAKRKRSSFTNSLLELDSRRVENISWRLWFKESVGNTLAEHDGDFYSSNILELVTSILPFSGSRLLSPQDLYSFECESIDSPSPVSPKAKRLLWY